MSGPFTTITVIQYQKMQDVIRAADMGDLGNGANCGATFIKPRPCSCGLDDLEKALVALKGKP